MICLSTTGCTYTPSLHMSIVGVASERRDREIMNDLR